MDAATMNQFLYNLHYKVEAMEQWAATVNDAVTDHAVHIDNAKAKSMNAFRSYATNESDTRRVMGLVQANDDALKARIEAVVAQIETVVVQSKADMQTLAGLLTPGSVSCSQRRRKEWQPRQAPLPLLGDPRIP